MTPMHIAAKADNAFSITYFRARGIDVDCLDNDGQTPLHYACYEAADKAIYYLLAWTNAVNLQDNQG